MQPRFVKLGAILPATSIEVHSNNYGFINDVNHDENLASPLIAVIGDSYVEAIMVPFSNTITGRLVSYFVPTARVYSFAGSGVPLSQYFVCRIRKNQIPSGPPFYRNS